MRNVVAENVAEHSYHVAMLTHALCTIANEQFNKDIAVEKAVTLALFHDVTEVITGDIPTPVKHHNSDILNNFRAIEHHAGKQLTAMIPAELKSAYDQLIGAKHRDQPLNAYVKAADLLDAYLKCITELQAGNREFAIAKQQIKQSLLDLAMPEVDYFLRHFAPSFEKTLDEISVQKE